jgi:ATP-dependent helicase HrpA
LAAAQLNQIPTTRREWLVPGLFKEKVVQLVKTPPQKLRAKVVPVPEFAQEFIDWMAAKSVESGVGANILQAGLVAEWGGEAKQQFAGLHETPAQYTGLTDWSFGELPELMEVQAGGQTIIGYPGLEDCGESVTLKVFDSPEEASVAHAKGLQRLFLMEQLKYFDKNVPNLTQMGMLYMHLGTTEELKRQLIDLAFARACLNEPLPNDEAAFRQRCADAKPRLGLVLQEISRLAATILAEWAALQKKLPPFAKAHPQAAADIEKQVGRLVYKRFLSELPFERLNHLPRYLKAAAMRLDKLRTNAVRDAGSMAEFGPLWQSYERRALQLAKAGVVDEDLEQYRWLLEELRVQLYAQELRTPVPVSVKRLQKMWESLGR